MANIKVGGTWYVDTAQSVLTTEKNQRVAYVILTTASTSDMLILREESTGAIKLKLRWPVANESHIFDFSNIPIVFTQGIYVDTITANASAMIVTTSSGGGNT